MKHGIERLKYEINELQNELQKVEHSEEMMRAEEMFLGLEIYIESMLSFKDFDWNCQDWYLKDDYKETHEIVYPITYWDEEENNLREKDDEMLILKLDAHEEKIIKVIQLSEKSHLNDARRALNGYILNDDRKKK